MSDDDLQSRAWTDGSETAAVSLELPLPLAKKVDAWASSVGAAGLASELEQHLRMNGEPVPRACPDCLGPTSFANSDPDRHYCSECESSFSAAEAVDLSNLLKGEYNV